jgi:hypothetical protein
MKQNPHDTVNEFFEMFDVTQRELIGFRESLAEEEVAAFNANNAIQQAVYEIMLDRTQTLLECMEQCQVRAAIRAAEFYGAN